MHTFFSLALSALFVFNSVQAPVLPDTLSRTEYVSIQSDGLTLSTGSRAESPSVSGDGRYVVFMSGAANLVTGDTNGATDIFLKDMQTGMISILSKSAANIQGNGSSTWPTITTNGRYVVFYSTALNLVANDTNGVSDVFLIDRGTDNDETNNTIERVSVTTSGGQIGYYSAVRRGAVSNNGDYVVFSTPAIGTVMGGGITDTNRNDDVYLWSRATGTSRLISHNFSSNTTAGNLSATNGIISDDGQTIAFLSGSTDIDANIGGVGLADTNGLYDVFLYDVASGTNRLISLTTTNQLSSSGSPSYLTMSSTGQFISWTTSGQLDPSLDTNTGSDVYLFDRDSDSLSLVSTFNYGTGVQHDTVNFGSYCSAISSDGRYVSFASFSVNLVPGKTTHLVGETFVHDMTTGNNIRVSVAANGDEATSGSPYSMYTEISDDGQYVVYSSVSTGLVAGIDDTNAQYDIFRSYADWTAPTVASTSLQTQYTEEGPSEFLLTFSEPLTRADSTSSYALFTDTGANSAANYVLVEAGPNRLVDFAACGDNPTTVDDTFITVNQAVYDNSTYTTQVGVNSGTALPIGRYRLLACGNSPYAPPALFDGVGNKMAADYIFDFVVAAEADEEDPIAAATPLGLLPIPLTGFPQGKTTPLSVQPANRLFNSMDLVLEIPSLNISAPIVGVPLTNGTWDVSWLGDHVGWLAGSAYPTWPGNTVLTGHVWNANNEPGVFFDIKELGYGDEVLIHSGGQTYVYKVRENERVDPEASQIVFKHEELDWITLVTCEDFNSDLGGYDYRRYIRAVLIDIY